MSLDFIVYNLLCVHKEHFETEKFLKQKIKYLAIKSYVKCCSNIFPKQTCKEKVSLWPKSSGVWELAR